MNDIEKELRKCEQALYEMQVKYPQLASKAANARYIYDQAWATAMDEIAHRAVADGKKPPTVAAAEAEATIKVADEMREARYAEADLDAGKKHLDTLQAILSSIQTRAKLTQIEMSLAR
jgi:hypothetical protein